MPDPRHPGRPRLHPPDDRRIDGHCPMGCGETLFVGSGGHITCAKITCPRPTAVDELLRDDETAHIVDLAETGFTVRHPMRERLDDALLQCVIHEHIAGVGRPAQLGRYRTRFDTVAGVWSWEALDTEAQRG